MIRTYMSGLSVVRFAIKHHHWKYHLWVPEQGSLPKVCFSRSASVCILSG